MRSKISFRSYCTDVLGLTSVSSRKMLSVVEETEKYLNKELLIFTMDDIRLLFITFNSISVSSLRVKCSIIRRYCEYNGYADNNFKDVTTEILESCCNNNIRLNKYLDKKSLLSIMDDLENPSDKWLLLSVFEGIKGDKLCNVTLTSGNEINENNQTIKLYDGSVIECSKELISIAKESCETFEYYSISKNEQINKITLSTDLILKPRNNCSDPYDIDKAYKRTAKKYFTIKNYLGNEAITVPRLYLSGMTYRIKQYMERNEKTFEESFEGVYDIRKLYGYQKYKPHELRNILNDYL